MQFDISSTIFINSLSGQYYNIDAIIKFITLFLPYFLVFLIILKWWSNNKRIEKRKTAIYCGLSTVLALLLNQIILLFFHRIRPYDQGITHLIISRSSDPSFPSDHATLAFAITTMLIYRKDSWRIVFLVLAILLSFSRIYVGTHFVSDVIGGMIIGILSAYFIHLIHRKLSYFIDKIVRIL